MERKSEINLTSMRNCHIVIVEDEVKQMDLLESYILKFAKEELLNVTIDKFLSPVKFITDFTCSYDFVFLDIQMPGVNGMELAHKIREQDKTVGIIFVTNLAKYAIEGYSVGALDYVLKPVVYQQFKLKFSNILAAVPQKSEKQILFSTKNGKFKIDINEIIYAETDVHRIVFHTLRGDFYRYQTMGSVEKELNDPSFSRCNSCYLVNLIFAKEIHDKEVLLDDGTKLAISRPRYPSFIKQFNQFKEQ